MHSSGQPRSSTKNRATLSEAASLRLRRRSSDYVTVEDLGRMTLSSLLLLIKYNNGPRHGQMESFVLRIRVSKHRASIGLPCDTGARTHKSGFVSAARLNVRFGPKATEIVPSREMTRWAKSGFQRHNASIGAEWFLLHR
jgi:hypothetical protein